MTAIISPAIQTFQFLGDLSGRGLALLAEVSVKGTLLLLVGLTSTLIMRRGSAAMRHLVWTLALNAMLLLPAASLIMPSWKVSVIPSSSTDRIHVNFTHEGVRVVEPGPRSYSKHLMPPPRLTPSELARSSWYGWVLALWICGSILIAARIIVGNLRVRRLVKRSRPFDITDTKPVMEGVWFRLGITDYPEVRTSSEIAVPFTWGVVRPVVLLPAKAHTWSHKHLEFVLAHELAHVRRLDYLTQMTAQITCALFWFHPLVWVAASEIRKEREQACDDIVLNLGHSASDYGEFLLAVTRGLRHQKPGLLTSVAMAQSSQLEARMNALLDRELNHRPLVASRTLVVSALAMALLFPVAAIRATADNSDGSISGTVHDPSGAVIPGADVVLINVESGRKTLGRTGNDGSYEFTAISPGRYQVEIIDPGFAHTKTAELELKRSGELRQNITLSLGEVTQTVIVSRHRPAIISAPARPAVPQRIRVGGLVESAKLIYHVRPVYSELAQKEGVEGTVVMRAVIGANGEILALSPSSGPDPSLTEAAMAAVRQWRYKPTLLDGLPVEVATTIDVTFRLED
jgi:TonB family protein